MSFDISDLQTFNRTNSAVLLVPDNHLTSINDTFVHAGHQPEVRSPKRTFGLVWRRIRLRVG